MPTSIATVLKVLANAVRKDKEISIRMRKKQQNYHYFQKT